MTKKIKSSLILLFLVQLLFAQDSNWHWQNPYPLPFIHKMYKTVDGRLLIQHDNDDIYQINDDDTFTQLDMNLPTWNYKTGYAEFYIISETNWIVFAPYVIYLTEDGGKTYEEITSNQNWKYKKVQFIDEKIGIATRYIGGSQQIVRTLDGGKTWDRILSDVSPISMEMINKDTIYYLDNGSDAKVHRTLDGGENWEELGNCSYCHTLKKVGENLVALNYYQIFISTDEGNSFNEVHNTFEEDFSKELNRFIESKDDVVITSSVKSIFKSNDGGLTWEQVNSPNPEVNMDYGFIKNDKSFYSVYKAPHVGLLKYDLDAATIESMISTPINYIQSVVKFNSGDLGIHSYSPFEAQHLVFTSQDNGYTWKRNIVKLPDGEKYARSSAHLRSDSSFYLGYEDRVYHYQNFLEEYNTKVNIKEIPEYYKYVLRVFENGTGIICGLGSEYMYYSKDEFNSYDSVAYPGNKIRKIYQISNDRYWLIGRKTSSNQKGVSCLISDGKVDSCYSYVGLNRTYNLHGDDLIISSYKKGDNIRINPETGMSALCPELKGEVRGIISKDTMIMQDLDQLFLANPNTCEKLELADISYSSYIGDPLEHIDLKFMLLDNGDIFGYDNDGYMIRKSENFLDTLLYNSSKEVEYETPTQEYQFIVYPNPTSDWLQVKDMPYGVECRIIDLRGQEQMRGKQSLIYTGQYPSGTYIIQFIQDGRLIESQKIVIQ